MGGPAQQLPEERQPRAGDGRRDVGGGVPDADGEDLDVGRDGEQARAEGQDALAVCGGALGEDGDDAAGVPRDDVAQGGEGRHGGGGRGPAELRGRQGVPHGAPQADADDPAAARVADGEDGVEDGGEVDGVHGGGEGGGDDGGRGRAGHAPGGLLREAAALDAVQLEVGPPDLRDGEEAPDQELVDGLGEDRGDVLHDEEVQRQGEEEDGQAEGEEAHVEELGGRAGGRGVRDEGGDAGACWNRRSSVSQSVSM